MSQYKKLIDVVPQEFSQEFTDTEAYQYREVPGIEEFETSETPWPGTHKNVHVWWELENGYAVGWNENPAVGWSFPVVLLKKKEVAASQPLLNALESISKLPPSAPTAVGELEKDLDSHYYNLYREKLASSYGDLIKVFESESEKIRSCVGKECVEDDDFLISGENVVDESLGKILKAIQSIRPPAPAKISEEDLPVLLEAHWQES